MRLTTKITYNYITPDNVENIDVLVCNKLGKLEDIEEELGIDLITLFKALKNGFWFVLCFDNHLQNTNHFHDNRLEINCKGITMLSKQISAFWFFTDYGKTWALTKEELTDH